MSDVAQCVHFLQELLRTESMPGEEREAAERVREEMERLGYDEVGADEVGSVVGWMRGGDAPSLMFNTHLDHVDAGDPDEWPHPPFGGEVHRGRVWGRGAVDIKGPLAAQVHGVARAARDGPLPGDVCVTAVVQEEVGGLGARWLLDRLRPDLTVVGEPSGNRLRRGHRGRVELRVRVRGRSVHASAPGRGINPVPVAGRFLARLDELDLPEHPELGESTLAPTVVRSDQESPNVVPSEVTVVCDCRTVPGQRATDVKDALQELLDPCLQGGAEGRVEIPVYPRVSYTGREANLPADNPAWILPADHPALRTAADTLEEAVGSRPEVGLWTFATDGGHFARSGLTVVGIGPGDEELAHTTEEAIPVEELEAALQINRALAREWPARYARRA